MGEIPTLSKFKSGEIRYLARKNLRFFSPWKCGNLSQFWWGGKVRELCLFCRGIYGNLPSLKTRKFLTRLHFFGRGENPAFVSSKKRTKLTSFLPSRTRPSRTRSEAQRYWTKELLGVNRIGLLIGIRRLPRLTGVGTRALRQLAVVGKNFDHFSNNFETKFYSLTRRCRFLTIGYKNDNIQS